MAIADNQQDEQPRAVIMSKVMSPDMANFSGNVHGGHLMQFLDYVAYVCATRYCRCRSATLSVDMLTFKKPVHVGELVTCYASVNYVGHTSMEIGIRAEAEDLKTGQVHHVISCFLTFVALDDEGKTRAIPALELNTSEDKRRFEAAKLRRKLRLEYEQKHAEIITHHD
ncbi:MAG: acyl-CoA thioesterase [Gammaproteobacteria bacterium]|nr:acyl-CoA thioesterase [Gammaproteobacteria bacterium]